MPPDVGNNIFCGDNVPQVILLAPTLNAPVPVMVVPLIEPEEVIAPPTFKFFAIATPPLQIIAPVDVVVLSVVFDARITPELFILPHVIPFDPTVKFPVPVIVVPDILPDDIICPQKTPPDVVKEGITKAPERFNDPPTYKFFAIPTPPTVIIEPVEVDVLSVKLLTEIPEVELTLPELSVPVVIVPEQLTAPIFRVPKHFHQY